MTDPSEALIADQYRVELHRPLPGAGGGLAAFAVQDLITGRTDLMAVQARPGLLPRAPILLVPLQPDIDGALMPLAHGRIAMPGTETAHFVVSRAPSGAALAASRRRWPEAELIDLVLRPAALSLVALAGRRMTHRGIRPDNVFQLSRNDPAVLGAAWAAPAASLQPALFEPPQVAMCPPAARGEGTIADDIYALGVLLICLALGCPPLDGLSDAEVIRRKLDLGSFAALAGHERLPAAIADLARGMLAEDPDHRPPPGLLASPTAARARRVAARPPRRAQSALQVAGQSVWNARALAFAIAGHPESGTHLLRTGQVDHWLRRSLGDGGLASRLDDAVRLRAPDAAGADATADALLVMRAIVALDPLAPLCWRGLAAWPDGIGPLLAAARTADADVATRIEEIAAGEVVGIWAGLRPERCDLPALRQDARQWRNWLRQHGPAGGLPRLAFALNALLPCTSPVLGTEIAALSELLPALERIAAQATSRPPAPLDAEIAAFIAARTEQRLEAELNALADRSNVTTMPLARLRLFAALQARLSPVPLPALAGWLAEGAGPILETWHSRPHRTVLAQRLRALAGHGWLAPMVRLIEDPTARAADQRGMLEARDAAARIDAELVGLSGGTESRAARALQIGQEIVVALGLGALALGIGVATF